MRRSGFTLPELVITLLLVGVLAFVALPRLFTRAEYEARAFRDQLVGFYRYAQKVAIGQRRAVCVAYSSSSFLLMVDADQNGTCEANQAGPTGALPYTLTVPAAVSVSGAPALLTFSSAGTPSAPVSLTVTGGGSSWGLTVEAETGYVH